jgi:hypothetical protein
MSYGKPPQSSADSPLYPQFVAKCGVILSLRGAAGDAASQPKQRNWIAALRSQ